MTSGGHTWTEGWNLQLQGRVRDLEADLAEAERHLRAVLDNMRSPAHWTLADDFLKRMADKREKAAAQAKDIDAFLEQQAKQQRRRMRVEPGHPRYMAHMLRHAGKCRQRTKDRPKRNPNAFRMFEFSGLYARLIKSTNARQRVLSKRRAGSASAAT